MRLRKFMLTGVIALFAGTVACGTPQTGTLDPTAEPTQALGQTEDIPTSETPSPMVTGVQEPGEQEPEAGADYVEDPTAGNIYVEKTGDASFDVAVNLEKDTILDTIVLGDSVSMKEHNVKYNSAKMEEDIYGSKYIKLKDSSHYMSFEVKVDPKKQNYITVKFWGGETGNNSAMILYGENSLLKEQDYGTDWPLLDYLGSEPELEGGYYYATYRIPLSMSYNKETVKLELRHFGNVDAYDLNGDGIKYVETENFSRAIYQISTHTDPFYTIQEEETVGLAETLDTSAVYKKAAKTNAYEFLLDKVNAATETIVKWQLYGTEFENNVAAGKIPELARGCLMTGGKASDTYDSMESFASKYYSKVLSGNAEYMKMLYGMAAAYELPENTYYHSKELLERMVSAWDFYVSAQGSNGGFASDKANWIGISSNTGKNYDDEGRQAANTIIPAGEKAIAESFVLLYEAVAATGMLDEAVDYNLDGVIDPVTEKRSTAYYQMFCKGAEFAFTYSNRECVNQDLLNLMMGYHFNKAAALLGDAVYSEDTVMTRLYAGLGITEHSYTKQDGTLFLHGGYQFSVKNAIAMETFGSGAGGYCGKAAMAYDILYDTDLLSRQEHEKITQVFRSYMTFQDWLLTDGDGNNFQLAEATAGFLCALVLQEEHWIRRFLYGKNSLTDLLSSVFMEDGMYFEMATSYMKLAEEILSQAVIAAENYGIPLKYFQVQGCYDETVLLAPWANRKKWAEDGKPFLGMSFERFQNNTDPYRNFKKYYDALLHFMTPDGIMFSSNDSNEHMFGDAFDRGYYLYGEKRYLSVVTEKKRDLLYGDFSLCLKDYRHYPESKEAYLSSGVGYGILRQEEGKHKVQAVLKYGPHGGYHGHFDRMSLVSVISNNKIFHNMEYAWYGYTSFLFKMWVQTSMAHNMVTVDQRMQEPTKGECILFEAGKEYQAMCVQTTARWCDPPYGGQTPYLDKFPEEKCQKEGRYILPPPVVREQGAIGEYSEPVFQRRLLLMVKGILVVLDYIKGERVHSFDCLYHPMGVYQLYGEKSELKPLKHTRRFGTDPFGAAQFITNCAWYESEDTVHLEFHYMQEEKEKRQLLEYAESSRLFCAYPKKKTVMIGKYPESSDTFLEEEITEQGSCKEKQGKKTVAFETRGTEAAFVTAVEVESELLEDVICEDFEKVVLMWKDGTQNVFGITGMKKESNQVMVTLL